MKKLMLLLIMCFVLFNIKAQNTNPVAVNDTVTITFRWGVPDTINVLTNDYDSDGDTIKLSLVIGAQKISDSLIVYTPDTYFNGLDSILYRIRDEHSANSNFAKVYINIINDEYYSSLDINNVKARFNAFGNHFWDLQNQNVYEVPKGSSVNSIFNSTLWIGGKDPNDSLHLAGERYRPTFDAADFYTGPLTTDGTTSVDTQTIAYYYKVWKINKSTIDSFIQGLFITIPEVIMNWPVHGDVAKNQSFYLAPFFDNDGNGSYDPSAGDYPLIRGDQAIFFIFNDRGDIHGETGGTPLGIEVHGMAYAFDCPSAGLNNTVFLNYKIFNRSINTYDSTYIGIFTDVDLGDAWDDYIGCDVGRGSYFVYNGKQVDGTGLPGHYGDQPPAQAVTILGGPYVDADGEDNPEYTGNCSILSNPEVNDQYAINGLNFGDSIIDNERMGMTGFVYFNNTMGVQGDPKTAVEYYNYLKGIWRDGLPMQTGGNAHPNDPEASGPVCKYMFPDNSDSCNWGTDGVPTQFPDGGMYWTEAQAGNIYGDRRGLGTIGPFTFEAGTIQELDLAFTWARADSGGPLASVELLKVMIDSVRTAYKNNENPCGGLIQSVKEHKQLVREMKVYPNPAETFLNVELNVNDTKTRYSIYDICGKIVVKGNLNSGTLHKISVDNLNKGFYVLRINDSSSMFSTKFVKQ